MQPWPVTRNNVSAPYNGWDSYADAVEVANRAAERFNISQTEQSIKSPRSTVVCVHWG